MKKISVLDVLILLAVIAALVVGFLTYKHFRQTADKQIEKTAKIAFQVFLRGVTITSGVSPIKPGDKTFISIRNVPYTDLKIVDVKIDTKKVVLPNPAGKPPFLLAEDYSQMFMYDVVVTVVDTAQFTKDGAVVGGNKIKIGLPITLEGKDYKFNGTVSNVQMITDDMAKKLEAAASASQQVNQPQPTQVNPQQAAAGKPQASTPATQGPQPSAQPQTAQSAKVQAPAPAPVKQTVQPKTSTPTVKK